MGELGLHGVTVGQEWGGLGLGYLEHVVAVEEVSRATAMPIGSQWLLTQATLPSHQSCRSAMGVGAEAFLGAAGAAVRSERVTAIIRVRRNGAVSPHRAPAPDRSKIRVRNAKDSGSPAVAPRRPRPRCRERKDGGWGKRG